MLIKGSAEERYQRGFAKGFAKGYTESYAAAVAKSIAGEEEGPVYEAVLAYIVAVAMLRNGIDTYHVAIVTGLSDEKVESIREIIAAGETGSAGSAGYTGSADIPAPEA